MSEKAFILSQSFEWLLLKVWHPPTQWRGKGLGALNAPAWHRRHCSSCCCFHAHFQKDFRSPLPSSLSLSHLWWDMFFLSGSSGIILSLTGPCCSDISQCSALWSCMGNCVGVFSLESLVLFCSGKFSSVVFPGAESSVLLILECPQLSFMNLLCLSFLVYVL